MPRDSLGTYSLPAGNPVVTATTITSSWANTTLTDIASALTSSLSVDGSVTTAKIANGAVTSGKIQSSVVLNTPFTTGLLTLTGGQIRFPSLQVPSTDVNVLDDYEEGTWTPAVTFATPGNLNVTYTGQFGKYTKIGRLVNIEWQLQTDVFTHTTASGGFRVTGIPFTATAAVAPCSVAFAGINKAGYSDITFIASSSSAVLDAFASGNGVPFSSVSSADVPSAGSVRLNGSMMYTV